MATLAEALELLRIADKALALPAPGAHVGDGLHVPMPPTWDGSGATPPGWTKESFRVVDLGGGIAENPKLGPALTAALALPGNRARLTLAERLTFDTASAALEPE